MSKKIEKDGVVTINKSPRLHTVKVKMVEKVKGNEKKRTVRRKGMLKKTHIQDE